MKGLYRPITTLTYVLNYTVLGNADRPAGYHVLNVLLHWGNAVLVHLLAFRLLGRRWLAFASALLFSAHPLATEAVTNIVGRADLLATGFTLAGLLLHVTSTTASGWRRAACLAGVALSAGLGLLSKESAIAMIGAIVLYDLVYRPSWRPRAEWVVLVPAVFGVWLTRTWVFSRLPAPYVSFLDNPVVRAGVVVRVLTALQVLARYLWLLLWPATLSCDYSYAQVPLVGWQVAAGSAALVGLVVVAIGALRRAPALAFFLLFSLLTWLPISNLPLTIGTIMGERLLYLPSIGFATGVAVGVDALARRMWAARAPLVAGAAIGIVALVLGTRTVVRNADWHDSISLWTAAVRAAPRSFKTHLALAEVLYAGGASEGEALDRVVEEMERARAIMEERPLPARDKASLVPLDLGLYYRLKGDELDDAEARPWYEKSAAALEDAAAIDHAVDDESREREAARGRRPADVADVGNYAIYQQLGVTLLRLGRNADAARAFTYMRHLAPNLVAAHVNLARAYRGTGDVEAAAVSILRAIALGEHDEDVWALLADTYGEVDGGECAVIGEGVAARLDERCPVVRTHLCEAYGGLVKLYHDAGQEPRAEPFKEKARRLGCTAEEQSRVRR